MNLREVAIGKIVRYLSECTSGFEDPKMVLIGGYALRAFTSFSRYTRDCDFVLGKTQGWGLDRLQSLLCKEMNAETCEKHDTYGFMRCVKVLDKDAKISIDFMEGEVRGRTDEQVFFVTSDFLHKARKVKVAIAKEILELYVPDYTDYLILKVMSARPSDTRDVATLVWENGIPNDFKAEAEETLAHPEIIKKNLPLIMSDIGDERFLDSWKGTFATKEFTETAKERVLKELKLAL